MPGKIITFSGKGGSGKTTLASMVLRELIRTGVRPILAVDADPNATLALTLGVECPGTMADLREDMSAAAKKPSQIPKERLMDMLMAELLSEQEGFDLLTMGRPEGPNCYCYVNGLLRRYLSILRSNYRIVLVDCEAGMEYLSRLVVDEIETIVLVAEETPVGLTTARRIGELADSLPMKVHRRVLAINKIAQPCPEAGVRPAQLPAADAVVEVPFDGDLASRCMRGLAVDGAAGAEARAAVEELTRLCLGETRKRNVPLGTTSETPTGLVEESA